MLLLTDFFYSFKVYAQFFVQIVENMLTANVPVMLDGKGKNASFDMTSVELPTVMDMGNVSMESVLVAEATKENSVLKV